jgi:hypothetical protein
MKMLPCAQSAIEIMDRLKANDLQNPFDSLPLFTHRVWRGDSVLHLAIYECGTVEQARRDGKHYFAWDRITKVELIYPDGTIEEIKQGENT